MHVLRCVLFVQLVSVSGSSFFLFNFYVLVQFTLLQLNHQLLNFEEKSS